MELKSEISFTSNGVLFCSNRTFMELKWEYAIIRAQQYLF